MRRRRIEGTAAGLSTASTPRWDEYNDRSDKEFVRKDAKELALPPLADDPNAFRRRDESPRQVLAAVALCVALAAVARGVDANADAPPDPGASFRRGALASLLLCASYTFLSARDGMMRRPHPGFWRALHGCNLWYAGMAAIFLVMRAEDGAVAMGWIFPSVVRSEDGTRGPLEGIGTNVAPLGSGGTLGMDHLDCRLTPANIRRQVFGLWFTAHCVGWWAKMLMLRDLWTCVVYSTIFELVELTLQVWVPEFQECYWDSLILDWLLANLCVGMTMGMITHRYLLRWPGLDWNQRSEIDSVSNLFSMLTPDTWRRFEWNPDNDPLSLLLNSAIWIAMLVGEINSFFLINIFQLPRDHAFNVLRQVFFCLTALPACEEWYEFTRHVRARTTGRATREYRRQYAGRKPRIGQSAWLLGVTAWIETAAIVKYAKAFDLFSKAGEFTVRYWGPWVASGALFGAYLSVHCWWYREGMLPRWLGVLKWSSFLPLLLLMRNYAF